MPCHDDFVQSRERRLLLATYTATDGADTTNVSRFGVASDLGITSYAGVPLASDNAVVAFTATGDANLDGTVDVSDLGHLAAAFRRPGYRTEGDFNYDGQVNVSDLGILAAAFRTTVSASVAFTGRPNAIRTLLSSGESLLGPRWSSPSQGDADILSVQRLR